MSSQINTDWSVELQRIGLKYFTIAAKVAVVISILFGIVDFYIAPTHGETFMVIRIGVAIIILSALLLTIRFKLKYEILGIAIVWSLAIQNAFMYSMLDLVDFQKFTFDTVMLFIGAGMLAIWQYKYSLFTVLVVIVAHILFFSIYSPLSLGQFFQNGGQLSLATLAIMPILIQIRYALTKKEVIARLTLAEANKELAMQKAVIEEKNKHITDSIKYAERIQSAILPKDDLLSQHFKEYFVLFKPKDIVSGDFYWFNKVDDIMVVAAADCTGHGVPGAFMSMIGNALLNQIVGEKKIFNPAKILTELKNGIMQSLKQKGEIGEAKDGMDIALCMIDIKSNKLEYAGAYNSLYLIRNNELKEYKATKLPVGIHHQEEDAHFINNEIKLESNDVIYIFSDGYHDQFGGEKGKKFMTKRFKELLTSINTESMQKQKQILEQTISEWMGDKHEQIDDILVMGIKF